MRVYISVKITGLSLFEYQDKFGRAESDLMARGYSVINPAITNATLPRDFTYEEYMKISMCELSMCDAIYMLDNWKDSEGAKREYQYAYDNDYTIMFQSDEIGVDIKK